MHAQALCSATQMSAGKALRAALAVVHAHGALNGVGSVILCNCLYTARFSSWGLAMPKLVEVVNVRQSRGACLACWARTR
jgi:hypothetical protein